MVGDVPGRFERGEHVQPASFRFAGRRHALGRLRQLGREARGREAGRPSALTTPVDEGRQGEHRAEDGHQQHERRTGDREQHAGDEERRGGRHERESGLRGRRLDGGCGDADDGRREHAFSVGHPASGGRPADLSGGIRHRTGAVEDAS
jgi:hypothetical protein